MAMTRRIAATGVFLGLIMVPPMTRAQKVSADGAMQTFNYLAEQFFSDVYFKFAPTAGTSDGTGAA